MSPLAWLVLVPLVLAALVGETAVWIRLATQGSQVPGRLEALRAQGQPVSLADLVGPAVPNDQNAAAGLEALAAELEALEPVMNAFLADADKPGWPTPEQINGRDQRAGEPGCAVCETGRSPRSPRLSARR